MFFQNFIIFFENHPAKMPFPLGISEGSLPNVEEDASLFLENLISDLRVRYLYRRAMMVGTPRPLYYQSEQ